MDQRNKASSWKPPNKKNENKYSSKSICSICGYVAAYGWTLKQHFMRRHTTEKPNKCQKCSKCYVTKGELTKHMAYHSDELPYKCSVCDSKYKTLCQKEQHENYYHEIEVHCNVCDLVFYKKDELRYHKRTTHGANKIIGNKISCNVCFRVFSSEVHLRNHLATHKSINCPSCYLKFASHNDLMAHKRTVHNHKPKKKGTAHQNSIMCNKDLTGIKGDRIMVKKEGRNSFECKICQTFFYKRKALMAHAEMTHPLEIEKIYPFVCKVCSKRFGHYTNLRTHFKIHENNRKFKCKLCNYSSIRISDLQYHMRNIHSLQRLTCEFCDQTFCSRTSQKYHINRHLDIKEFKCEVCSLEFYERDTFVYHMETHDVDGYLCTICGLQLKTTRAVRNHTRRHSKPQNLPKIVFEKFVKHIIPAKDFRECKKGESISEYLSCKMCDNLFPSRSLLQWHKRSYHLSALIFECYACGESCSSEQYLHEHMMHHQLLFQKDFGLDFNLELNEDVNA